MKTILAELSLVDRAVLFWVVGVQEASAIAIKAITARMASRNGLGAATMMNVKDLEKGLVELVDPEEGQKDGKAADTARVRSEDLGAIAHQ